MKLRLLGRRQPASIVRLLPLRDEADILERNLRWYADSQVATVAFDNASTDATPDIARAALEAGELAGFERSEQQLEWSAVGSALLGLAALQRPDLILVAAADEFIEVADGSPLRVAVEADLRAGHDVLRVDTMEFCLTDEDDSEEPDPLVRMRRYSPFDAVLIDRGLRWSCGIEWSEAKRLKVIQAAVKRSPRRYINRHYPLRSPAQALSKAKSDRLGRVLAGSSAAGFGPLVEHPRDLVLPGRKLPRYDNDHSWTDKPVVAGLRLAVAPKLISRFTTKTFELQLQLDDLKRELAEGKRGIVDRNRKLADLRKRYSDVMLERDRLAAGGARPTSGHLAASPGWYDEHYRLTLGAYDSHYSESVYFRVWEQVADRIDTDEGVLEIGCGSGQLAQLLMDRGLKRYRGFDFSEFAVDLARQRLPDVEFHVADARTTSLLDEAAYEVALCTEVLEHLDDDIGLLERIRPGARVLATVPNFDSTSHLRFFTDEAAVVERYGQSLDRLIVTRVALRRESAIFLLDGVALGPAGR